MIATSTDDGYMKACYSLSTLRTTALDCRRPPRVDIQPQLRISLVDGRVPRCYSAKGERRLSRGDGAAARPHRVGSGDVFWTIARAGVTLRAEQYELTFLQPIHDLD